MPTKNNNTVRLFTWNINGWRSAERKGFASWLEREKPNICCLQEIRLGADQLNDLKLSVPGYFAFFSGGKRPGYSGTAILSLTPPKKIGLTGLRQLDNEGRTLVADFADFTVVNAYVPNGNRNEVRLRYKHNYLVALRRYATELTKKGKNVIICGDFNTAHTPLDLTQPPSRAAKRSGFLQSERVLMDSFLFKGWQDSFRVLHPDDATSFTWWAAHSGVRERNRGWRFDYVFLPNGMTDFLHEANMHSEVLISDHCPFSVSFRGAAHF